MAFLVCLGVIGEIASWATSPAKVLYVVAENGLLPSAFVKEDKHGIPADLMFVHGIVASIWATVFTLSGSGKNLSFLTALSLTVVIYVRRYFFFIGYLKLVHSKNDYEKSYEVLCGKVGKPIIAVAGLLTSIFTFGRFLFSRISYSMYNLCVPSQFKQPIN